MDFSGHLMLREMFSLLYFLIHFLEEMLTSEFCHAPLHAVSAKSVKTTINNLFFVTASTDLLLTGFQGEGKEIFFGPYFF